LWVGEKKFTKKGQEETFLRWRVDKMGGVIPPFTFQKKSYVTPSGQVNGNVAPNSGSTTGGSLSYFSQMNVNVHSRAEDTENGGSVQPTTNPRYDIGGSAQPIAGPMEGFQENSDEQTFLDRELGGP
jgi:hypothetical protein